MTTGQTATGDASATAPADGVDDGDPGLFGAPKGGFASQADAETWLGTVWRDLAADGVSAASLFEDDRLVYGPMSLEPS